MKRARCGRDFSANQADAYGYASAGEARPNAVSQVRLANGSLRRYGYDASGNLVCQTDDGQSGSCDQWPQFEAYYNHNQQPSYQRRKASGSGANAQYAESWYSYGADQQPARQWGIERIEGCTLDSLGCLRHHRIHLDRYEDSVGTLRHIDGRARQARTRAYIGDYLVATRGDAGQLELSYLLRDRLGSVVGVEQVTLSDRRISGLTPETRHAFDAFGAPRSNRWWSANRWHDIGTWYSPTRTQQGFTGHERLSGLQLIHMRGRVFDPVLGRFHGVDPIIQFPLSSQGLNPYSYILNNPMAGVDPTGYCQEDIGTRIKRCGGALEKAIDAVATIVSTAQSVGVFNTPCGMAVCAGNGAGASSAQSGGSASDIGSLGELAKTTASDIVEGAKNVAAGVGSAMFPEAWGSVQGGEVESTASDWFWGAFLGVYNTGARTLNGLNDLPYLLHGLDSSRPQAFSVVDTPPEMRKAAGTVELGMSILGMLRTTGGAVSGSSREIEAFFGSFNAARRSARESARLGDDAIPFVSELGPARGRVVGMMSPDGRRGWRVDWDPTKGFHVNWWDRSSGLKRNDSWRYGANVVSDYTLDDYRRIMEHFP